MLFFFVCIFPGSLFGRESQQVFAKIQRDRKVHPWNVALSYSEKIFKKWKKYSYQATHAEYFETNFLGGFLHWHQNIFVSKTGRAFEWQDTHANIPTCRDTINNYPP